MFPLRGKVALVTGGGRGIGAGIAVTLAQAGADVAVASRSISELEQVAADIAANGRRSLVLPLDVRDVEAVGTAVSRIVGDLGRLDVLVNNAGIHRIRPFLEADLEHWEEVFAVNLTGAFICSQAVARVMAGAQGGRIVNISSHFADEAHEGRAAYCASKAGLESLTRGLALELAPFQITVNSLRVGPVPGGRLVSEAASREARDRIQAGLAAAGLPRRAPPPLGPGKPADVGSAVTYLASDAAAWITGASLHVDGGIHLR